MSETATVAPEGVRGIGPGRLILVVGPSGAGKDTLLGLARQACSADDSIVFAQRVVTRQASSFEDNVHMSDDAFLAAVTGGEFAIHWEAHGHRYGVPRKIDDDIRAGRTVVVNASRTVIKAVRQAYANVLVVAVTAPAEVLAQRLAMRSRASDGALAQRLSRKVDDDAAPDRTIVNVSSAEFHARQLAQIVMGRRLEA